MLHACLSKFDATALKQLLEARKSTKIEVWELQNPSQKQFYSDRASEDAFKPPFFREITNFNWFLDPKMEPKSKKKRLKFDAENQHGFEDDFSSKFLRFGLRKWTQNWAFSIPFSKKPILQKSLFFLRKIAIFQVRSFQKSNKNRCKNTLENDIEKKGSRI